jgi:hypothetical protein
MTFLTHGHGQFIGATILLLHTADGTVRALDVERLAKGQAV